MHRKLLHGPDTAQQFSGCCATHWIVIQPQLAISACNIPVIMSEKDWWQQAATHQMHPW